MRRTAIVRRSCGTPSVASRRDTDVVSQGACNGLREWVRGTDEVVSVSACTMGVVTGGPHATEPGSVLANLHPRPWRRGWAGLSQNPGGQTPADRAVVAPRHHDTPQVSAARCRRAGRIRYAGRTRRRMDVRCQAKRMMKRHQRDRAWCRDRNSRGLSPQDSNRHLPFLFHDARVELGRSATEC